ncbi:SusC/RagA family TonB-linked outer membrane protein [Echinicola pacifica]|uniref:SusC/RagA family TonB-linked outer membrane protein n=1 Tax=Echinicola pacifica TaxID=346377 RepID=A0A918PJE3_9BACT|nr:TonB-dependent receptor [Echinicola pacifica]GGZ13065.1 SusC/RagA family TonB-linked outer membrane protein [Echinicola pacifica]
MKKFTKKKWINSNWKIVLLSFGLLFSEVQKPAYSDSFHPAAKADNEKIVKEISGIVTDRQGNPIPGVSVLITGSNTGIVTDLEGKFTIEAEEGDVLSFSFIGMKPQKVNIGSQTVLNIVLKEDVSSLDEVVVVGYGTQKKANVTSSVTTVDAKELGTITQPNIGSALQGRAPGLFVRDAGYNQGLGFLVRGSTTIGNNSPLFIVDGIPQNALTVDPNDIASISILKDGAASAIYGSRAAAGVVLITTKSGSNEKVQFSYETYFGWSNLTTTQEAVGSVPSAQIMNEASLNSGGQELFTEDQINLFKTNTDHWYANTDWKKELLKTEHTQRHYLSATGGNEKTNYYLAFGYRSIDGIMKKGINGSQYSLRTNLSTQLKDNINLTTNLSYILTDNTSPSVNNGIDNIYTHLNVIAPFLPVRQTEEGDSPYAFLNQAGSYSRGFWNPLWELEAGSSNSIGKTFTINTNLDWTILPGLKAIGRFSGIFHNSKSMSNIYKGSTTNGPPWFSDINSLSKTFADNNQFNVQTFLSYEKSINNHYFNALGGWDVQFDKYSFLSASRVNFQFDDLLTEFNAPNSGDKEDITGLNSNTTESALQSAVARVNYNYAERYFIELAGRYDGSSVFAPEHRYGFFPAASAGWLISRENFFGFESMDMLKLRASYGVSGNNGVNGSYFSNIVFGTYYFGAGDQVVVTAAEGGIPFRNLKWETTNSANIGIDFSFNSGKFGGSIDVYNKITKDILLPSPVQGTIGTNRIGPAINAGKVKNSGIELSLNHRNTLGNGLHYGITLVGSYNDNEIIELTDAFSEYSTSYRKGDPLGAIYGYESDGILKSEAEAEAYRSSLSSGINPNTSAGDIKYIDHNGDGKLDFEDRVVIAETVPKISYGLTLDGNWKNFDFQAFIQGVGKTQQYSSNDLFGNFAWIPEEAQDAWSPDNQSGTYPRLLLYGQQTYFQNFSTTSDFWSFDGSYLRLKNIQLGYTLPLTKNRFFESLRVYLTGTNVLTASSFRPGFDPESNGLNIPPLKTYTLGLNVKF